MTEACRTWKCLADARLLLSWAACILEKFFLSLCHSTKHWESTDVNVKLSPNRLPYLRVFRAVTKCYKHASFYLNCSYVLDALATTAQLEHGVQWEWKHAFLAKRDTAATTHYELMQAKPEKILLTLAHVHLLAIKAMPFFMLLQYSVAGSSFLTNTSILRRKTSKIMRISEELTFSYLLAPEEVTADEMRTAHFHRWCDRRANSQLDNPVFLFRHFWKWVEAHFTCHSCVGALRHAAPAIAFEFHLAQTDNQLYQPQRR